MAALSAISGSGIKIWGLIPVVKLMGTSNWGSSEETLVERISKQEFVGEHLAERTRDIYARKMTMISRQLSKPGHRAESCTPVALMAYFAKLVENKSVSASTARLLKSAAIFWLSEEAQEAIANGKSIEEHEEAYQYLQKLKLTSLPKKTTNTSSLSRKSFPYDLYEKISDHIDRQPMSAAGEALKAFLTANLLVGLRPSEWLNASFSSYLFLGKDGNYVRDAQRTKPKSEISLVVYNAKATHGRANGEYRVILLHGITDKDLASLLTFKSLLQEFVNTCPTDTTTENAIDGFFKGLRRKLNDTYKAIGIDSGSKPSLYSTRHQVIADAKNTGLSSLEIAAMFGHKSVLTAKKHYGRKNNGRRVVTFKPSQESIAAVKNNNDMNVSIADQQSMTAKSWLMNIRN